MPKVRSGQEVPRALDSDQGALSGRQPQTNLCAVDLSAVRLPRVSSLSAVDTRQISKGKTAASLHLVSSASVHRRTDLRHFQCKVEDKHLERDQLGERGALEAETDRLREN